MRIPPWHPGCACASPATSTRVGAHRNGLQQGGPGDDENWLGADHRNGGVRGALVGRAGDERCRATAFRPVHGVGGCRHAVDSSHRRRRCLAARRRPQRGRRGVDRGLSGRTGEPSLGGPGRGGGCAPPHRAGRGRAAGRCPARARSISPRSSAPATPARSKASSASPNPSTASATAKPPTTPCVWPNECSVPEPPPSAAQTGQIRGGD